MSTTKKTSSAVNAIVDNAFVPNMQEKEPVSAEEKMAAFFQSLEGSKISTPTLALPSNGEHSVVITSYEYKNGYKDNGDYFLIDLKDVDKNITWAMTLPANSKDVMDFLGEINMYNKGIVYGLSPLKALGKLEKSMFRVWTQQYENDKGETRAKTYSNPVKYEKFARYIAWKKSEKKAADEEYKAKKASRENKDPWED